VFSSKEFSLFPLCKVYIVLGCALGPFGGLSTRQLPAPYGKKEKMCQFTHNSVSTDDTPKHLRDIKLPITTAVSMTHSSRRAEFLCISVTWWALIPVFNWCPRSMCGTKVHHCSALLSKRWTITA